MIILGIDPGTKRAGYGLIEKSGSKLKFLKAGILKASSADEAEQLNEIALSLEKLLDEFKPEIAGIEKLYFVKNQKTGIKVAQAKGVISFVLNRNKIKFFEFAPTEIKQAVTGYGNSDKKMVARMVEMILGEKINLIDDALDALAVAIRAASERK